MIKEAKKYYKKFHSALRLRLKELEDPRYREANSLIDGEEGGRIALLAKTDQSGYIKARYFVFNKEFWIGRDPELNDLVLSESSICLRHCRLCQYAGNFYIEDFASKNGTYLNGRRLQRRKQILLPDKCLLKFADLNFYFEAD
ncbi:MAG: FHA domain-containing protein [Eubacteriales bacterium]|nr:FHA domain-containing protein [Eubacteriales bacterium]